MVLSIKRREYRRVSRDQGFDRVKYQNLNRFIEIIMYSNPGGFAKLIIYAHYSGLRISEFMLAVSCVGRANTGHFCVMWHNSHVTTAVKWSQRTDVMILFYWGRRLVAGCPNIRLWEYSFLRWTYFYPQWCASNVYKHMLSELPCYVVQSGTNFWPFLPKLGHWWPASSLRNTAQHRLEDFDIVEKFAIPKNGNSSTLSFHNHLWVMSRRKRYRDSVYLHRQRDGKRKIVLLRPCHVRICIANSSPHETVPFIMTLVQASVSMVTVFSITDLLR